MTVGIPGWDKLWLEPNLAVKGKKPVGAVELRDKKFRGVLPHRLPDIIQLGVPGLNHSAGVTESEINTLHGAGWSYSGGTSDDHTVIPVQGILNNDFTVIIVYRNNDGTDANKWFFSEGANTNQIAGFINESGKLRFYWRNSAGTNANIIGTTSTNDGEIHVAAVRGNHGGNIRLYLDGNLEGTQAHPGGTFNALATTIGALRRPTTVELEASSDIYFVAWRFDKLSESDVQRISKDIYNELLTPAGTVIIPAVAVGGATTITPTAATLNWAEQAFVVNASTNLLQSADMWNWTAQSVNVNAATKFVQTLASWNWTGNNYNVNDATTVTQGASSWNWTAQNLAVITAKVLLIAGASWNWAANAVTVVQDTTIGIAKAVWKWTAQDFFWTGKSLTQFWFSIKSSIRKSIKSSTRKQG